MALPQPVPQSPIQGKLLAIARGTFMYDDGGKGYYNFIDDDAFQWKLNPVEVEKLEIEIDDLYDCCEQAVKQFGDPDDYRVKMGLQPNSGYTNLGITFTSKTNPNIVCVFTPTSNQGGEWDSYFEWYLKDESMADQDSVASFFQDFEKLAGDIRAPKGGVASFLTVPTMGEAREVASKVLSDSEMQSFLGKVLQYEKNPWRGKKLQLEEEIIHEWKNIKRKSLLAEAEDDSKLMKTAKYLAKKFHGEAPEVAEEDRAVCSIKSETGIEFTCELLLTEKGLEYVLKRDDSLVDDFRFDGLTKQNVLAMTKMISDQLFMADALEKNEDKFSMAFRMATKLAKRGDSLTESIDRAVVKYDIEEEYVPVLKKLVHKKKVSTPLVRKS